MKTRTLFSLVVIVIFAVCAFAGDTHTVRGRVKDENGKGLPGANVVVVGTGKGASTNLAGDYEIKGLPSGTFEFRVSMMGYETTSQDVTIVADQEISFKLLPKAFKSQPVIVTASRTQQRLQDSPVTTSVIEAEKISDRNFLSADEAMRFVGGVTMVDDQVSIRNSTGYAKGAGTRVLVMVDGVPVISGDTGDIKWDALPIGQIQQVEVVKSAGSALYGSNAMGGVINFITKRPDQSPKYYKITSSFGVYDNPAYEEWQWSDRPRTFHRLGIEHSRSIGKWGVMLSLEEKMDENYRQAEDYMRGQVFAKAVRPLNGMSKLSFMLNSAYEDHGSALEWRDQAHATMVDTHKVDDRVWSSKVQFNTIYDGNAQGGKRNWSLKGYLNYTSWRDRLSTGAYDSVGNRIYDNHFSHTNRMGIDGQYTFIPFDDHCFTTGSEFSYTVLNANIFGERSGVGGAIYIQDEISKFDPLVGSIGMRGDVFHVNSSNNYEGETYGQLNPKLGLVYRVTDNVAARGSIGSGFRMPTMAELFTEVTAAGILKVQPNPYLKAEQAYCAEAGVNWIDGNQMIDFAIFNNWYTNMIEPVPIVGNQVQFDNIQDANIFGVETSLNWNMGDISKGLFSERVCSFLSHSSFSSNYLYTRAVNITKSDRLGETVLLPYRPAHNFLISSTVDYWKHGTVILDYRYKSKPQLGLYTDDPVVDQHVVNAAHKFTFTKWSVQLKVSNLLNWNYIEIDRNLAPIRNYSITLTLDL